MDELWNRLISDLTGRLTGPMTFRLFLQPGMAIFFACRDGFADARAGRPPHFWRMVTGPPEARKRRAMETVRAVSKVFIMAVVMDCVYQWIVFRWLYPLEAMVTAVILAIVPYMLLRGLANRVGKLRMKPRA